MDKLTVIGIHLDKNNKEAFVWNKGYDNEWLYNTIQKTYNIFEIPDIELKIILSNIFEDEIIYCAKINNNYNRDQKTINIVKNDIEEKLERQGYNIINHITEYEPYINIENLGKILNNRNYINIQEDKIYNNNLKLKEIEDEIKEQNNKLNNIIAKIENEEDKLNEIKKNGVKRINEKLLEEFGDKVRRSKELILKLEDDIKNLRAKHNELYTAETIESSKRLNIGKLELNDEIWIRFGRDLREKNIYVSIKELREKYNIN